jgi:hypothetical protein
VAGLGRVYLGYDGSDLDGFFQVLTGWVRYELRQDEFFKKKLSTIHCRHMDFPGHGLVRD